MSSGFLGGGVGPRAMAHQGLANPVPVAGAELLTNGNMETGDPPTGWGPNASATLVAVADERTGGVGSKSLSVTRGTSNFSAFLGVAVTSGTWYQNSSWRRVISTSEVSVLLHNPDTTVAIIPLPTTSAAWISALGTGRIAASGTGFYRIWLNPGEARIDDASCKPLTLASLLSTRAYAAANCDLSAAVTLTSGTQAGLVARLDSAISPANFIIAYLDGGGNVKCDTCKAGVYANVAGASGAVTYVAGRVLRLVVSGTDVSVYYHGTQVGTTQTVTDAGLDSNVRHGKFSTYAANVLASYVAA